MLDYDSMSADDLAEALDKRADEEMGNLQALLRAAANRISDLRYEVLDARNR